MGGKNKTYTLYLIRHGEACHNVREKQAKQAALETALADGLAPDSAQTKARMEEARKAVLEDPSFFDAELSEQGKQEAISASREMHNLCVTNELPYPTEVLVSPLQRTLQTADLVFPQHDNIRVREELRERLTGRPADNRASALALTKSFQNRFSFFHLRMGSILNMKQQPNVELLTGLDQLESSEELDKELDRQDEAASGASTSASPVSSSARSTLGSVDHGSSFNADEEKEDERKLQERAAKLLDLVRRSPHESVAVISHKGYLRGLEHSTFGLSDTVEFQNCEIRAYRIRFAQGKKCLESVERLK